MIISTTPSIEGKPVKKYLDIVVGDAVMGANVFKDFFASVTDIVGGRSGAYEKEMQRARETALAELEFKAAETGANAVIGVSLDYEVMGKGGSMIMVVASGTAVII